MVSKKKMLFSFFLAFAIYLLAGHLYYYTTGDFQKSHLLKAKAASQKNKNPLKNDKEVEKILQHSFYYLGKGHQTFAFVSDDGNYVLKLFKKDYLSRNGWLDIFPPIAPFRGAMLHQGNSKRRRKKKLLNGYTTAFSHDKENSGLLAFHLFAEKKHRLKAVLFSGLGMKEEIDLNDFVFAIQVKAVTAKKELFTLLSQGKVGEAKKRVAQLFCLYFESFRNDIFDRDHNFLDNTGFYCERAIRQDVGKISWLPGKIDSTFVEKEIRKIKEERLSPWLKRNFPQHEKELMESIDH